MNNKFSEIYLEKNMESFGSFKDSKKVNILESNQNIIKNNIKLIENFASFGKCPGGNGSYDCKYTYDKKRDNEKTSSCNTSCQKTYTYREYDRQNNNPQQCVQYKTRAGAKHNLFSCEKKGDINVSWRTEILSCNKGEGDCPHDPVDCVYSYGKCQEERLPGGGRKCVKKLKITKKAAHGGTACPTLKEIECPPDGDGCPYIPVDCEEGYGACKILDDIDVPSNLIGKCGKKNVIYKNSNHGGKSCVNSKYKPCNDGEGECPKDCDGNWTECNEDCKSIFIKSINESNGGKCPPENKPKPECKPGMGKCAANIDCEGEWSECTSYPDCERVYSHKVKQSGKGINCRYRDGFTQKCDSCEAPAPPPKEPGVIDDTESQPVNDSTPQTPSPVISLPEEIPPVKIPPNITPVPPSKPKPNPSKDSEQKTEQKDENKEEQISETSMLSNENTLIIIYMMGAIILLLFIFIVIYEPKEIVLNIE